MEKYYCVTIVLENVYFSPEDKSRGSLPPQIPNDYMVLVPADPGMDAEDLYIRACSYGYDQFFDEHHKTGLFSFPIKRIEVTEPDVSQRTIRKKIKTNDPYVYEHFQDVVYVFDSSDPDFEGMISEWKEMCLQDVADESQPKKRRAQILPFRRPHKKEDRK